MTMPLSGTVFVQKQGLAIINLQTKFEVSMFTHYIDMKGNAKCTN